MTALASSAAGRPLRSETRQIRRGVAWNGVGLAASKGSSILAKLILARLLVPEHFGFVSMVLVFIHGATIVADLGFKDSLVHRRHDRFTRLVYDSAFLLLLLAAAVTILFMWLVGVPMLVWFYGEPQLSEIGLVMSIAILFQNLRVIPEARLTRAMRFKQAATAEISGTLIGCVTALVLALSGAGVWSLVAQTLVAAACTTIAMFILAGWRPRLRLKVSLLRDLRSFSTFVLGSRALIYAQQNLDYLLIGKMIGAYAVGIYAIAWLLTETLRTQVYWLAGKVVFPVYSRVLGRNHEVRAVYLGTVRYMSLAIFPAAIMLFLFADELVPVLFTPKWNEAVIPIKILAIASMVVVSAGTPGQVLRGLGRPETEFRINLTVTFLVALPALWIGIAFLGLPGAAIAVLVYQSVSRVAHHVAIRQAIDLSGWEVLSALGPALFGCGLMVASEFILAESNWIVKAVICLALYAAAVFPAILPLVKPRLRKFIPKPRRRTPHPPIVMILGTDGTGKTSLARNLEQQLAGGKRLYLGMSLEERWVIRPARAVEAFRLQQHNRLVRETAGALMWYLLFPLEVIARRVLGALEGPHALLIDRVPGQPYLRGGMLSSWYRLLLPRPDRTILLVGDARTIAERKPEETTVARTTSEMDRWEKVACRTGAGGVIRLDTTRLDLQSCTRMVLDDLANLDRRTARSLPELRIGRSALVWLTPTKAYKLFWGGGARLRREHELRCSAIASRCPVWGEHFLPAEPCRNRYLICSPRGQRVERSFDRALDAFLEDRLQAAARQSPPLPATQLVETEKMRAALGEDVARPFVAALEDRLSALMLPAGPIHGDLHRDNVVTIDDRFRLIDCDRFNPLSSPLFDRINFDLTERRNIRPARWIDILLESEQLVRTAMQRFGLVASTADVTLAYGLNRIALEGFAARYRGRPLTEYPLFASRLLKAHAAARSASGEQS